MKKYAWIFLAVLFVVVMVAAVWLYPKLSERYTEEPPAPAVSDTVSGNSSETLLRAADFTVYDDAMNPVTLFEKQGKPVIVNFWASWCGPCKSEMPAFQTLYEQYADEVEFMMINLTDGYQESLDDVRRFLADTDYTFPVYYDMEQNAANTYGVYSIPATLFITADGFIFDARVGAMNEVILENHIQKLLQS